MAHELLLFPFLQQEELPGDELYQNPALNAPTSSSNPWGRKRPVLSLVMIQGMVFELVSFMTTGSVRKRYWDKHE